MVDRAPDRAEVEARLRKAGPAILRLGVRRVALFGSIGRDAARPHSDVDLLVELEPGEKSFDRFSALGEMLEDILGRPVDLVTTEALSPFLGPHILAEAVDVVRAA
jgi:predicted nucleotidyltransferase